MTKTLSSAVKNLEKFMGIHLNEIDVHLIEPFDTRKKNLTVYGVETLKHGKRSFIFYCVEKDRFATADEKEKYIKIRQNGDTTLVGSQELKW